MRGIAEEIRSRLHELKQGSLVVFGDIFGGRIDNIHTAISVEVAGEPERLIVGFDHGETLEIWDPSEIALGPDEFRIGQASRVRWEWFYYGHPQTPENLRFIEHVKTGERVTVTTNGLKPRRGYIADPSKPAVEILSYYPGGVS